MTTRRYFESFEVKRFRGFRELKIPKLRRFNVIGGMNGVGKTTLLEAMFLHLDRADLMFFTRPSVFRSLAFAFRSEAKRIFWNGDHNSTIEFTARTRAGKEVTQISYGTVPQPPISQVPTTQVPSTAPTNPLPITTATTNGIIVRFLRDSAQKGLAHYVESPGGLLGHIVQQFTEPGPTSQLVSPLTRYIPKDLADGFTNLVQRGSLDVLLGALRVVQPNLSGLQLLQIADTSVIHGDVGVGLQIPINTLGDGALTISAIILAIVRAENGVLLIDEFDAAVHYSVLRQIWAIIGEVAGQFNCQLMVTTHSRECIQAASDGMADAELSEDLSYIRLDRVGDGIEATSYAPNELASALKAEWEVR